MGLAYLPDGTPIDYQEYLQHPHWKKLRELRFAYDYGKCVACHKDLYDGNFNTHHLTYIRCGHERIQDLMTLCVECHELFHQSWNKAAYWEGSDAGHWNEYDLEQTAKLCSRYWKQDKLICKDIEAPNMCHLPYIKKLVETYAIWTGMDIHPMINPQDVSLFVRNKRYELWFKYEEAGKTKEEFLNDYYGEKVRGKNPIRQLADQFFKKHKDESYHLHYSENENINLLMQRVKELEEK